MLIRPTEKDLEDFGEPDFTIYNAGQFPANRFTSGMTSATSVEINFKRREMVILGTEYAGEMKKGIFSVMVRCNPLDHIGVWPRRLRSCPLACSSIICSPSNLANCRFIPLLMKGQMATCRSSLDSLALARLLCPPIRLVCLSETMNMSGLIRYSAPLDLCLSYELY